ncbi:hypothetical protein Pint_10281 [Pistacia integerrima]|uniref:Uncharacterized protein n=1 Tax=Pistacia integerrima TaxID=434235 RepID=A0ACC0XGU8_9ROSI|nr:hypothetical protein Pint_10281 [Pistacia integerrima]
MGLTLLAQSSIPKKFWVDAFLTSIFIINRLPTKVLNFSSPFECLFHLPLDFSYFCSFGCQCFPCLRPYMPNKLPYRSTPCIFIGYCSNQKGFRCYDPYSRRVYISRNVIFDELLVYNLLSWTRSSVPSTGNSPPLLLFLPSHIFPSSSPSTSISPSHTTPIIPSDHEFSIPPDTPPDIAFPVSFSPSNIFEPPPTAPTSTTPSFQVVTRSQTSHLKPCTYSDFHLYYSTRHPLRVLHASMIIFEPYSYAQAAAIPEWH